MKKFVVLALAACMASVGMAQVKSYKTAKKYLGQEKYTDAASLIEDVVVNPETSQNQDAWILRGRIYLKIAANPLLARDYPNALVLAKESFDKVLEMDPMKSLLLTKDFNDLLNVCVNSGANKFEQKKYAEALADFELGLDVVLLLPPSPAMEELKNNLNYNKAISAANADIADKAIEAYTALVEAQYDDPDMYVNFTKLYLKNNQKEEAAQLLEKALTLYPDAKGLYINASLLYLEMKENEKSSHVLNSALEKWSDDASLYFLIGYAYGEGNFNEAEQAYLKAVELNPEYSDAIQNLVVLYTNKGNDLSTEANNLPLEENDKYEELKKMSNELVGKAIPYLEKLVALHPENVDFMLTLRDSYRQIGQVEKEKELSEKIKQMQQ